MQPDKKIRHPEHTAIGPMPIVANRTAEADL